MASGIQLDDRCNNVTVTANTCNDTRSGGSRTQQYGIRHIVQTAGIGATGATIVGNTCNNNTSAGIRSSSSTSGTTLSRVTIDGNNCNDNGGWGIFSSEVTAGNLSGISVSNNVCYNNTTQDIRLSIADVVINENRYSTQQDVQYWDISGATPSVVGRRNFRANNAGSTTVTAFNNGVDGQEIQLRASNGNTTIAQGGLIANKGGLSVTIPSDGTIAYRQEGTVWREIFRSF